MPETPRIAGRALQIAEQIKIEVGSALPELENPPADFEIRGRDLMTGIPKVIKVSYSEIAFALDKSVSKIEEAVLKALEIAPPELSADIYDNGIQLADVEQVMLTVTALARASSSASRAVRAAADAAPMWARRCSGTQGGWAGCWMGWPL